MSPPDTSSDDDEFVVEMTRRLERQHPMLAYLAATREAREWSEQNRLPELQGSIEDIRYAHLIRRGTLNDLGLKARTDRSGTYALATLAGTRVVDAAWWCASDLWSEERIVELLVAASKRLNLLEAL